MSYCFVFKSLLLLTGSFSGLVSVKNLIRNYLKRQSPKSLVGNVLVPSNWIVKSFHVTLMTFIIIRLWSQHHNTQCLIKQHEVRKNSRAHIKQNVIIFIDRFKVWVKAKQKMFWPLTNRLFDVTLVNRLYWPYVSFFFLMCGSIKSQLCVIMQKIHRWRIQLVTIKYVFLNKAS